MFCSLPWSHTSSPCSRPLFYSLNSSTPVLFHSCAKRKKIRPAVPYPSALSSSSYHHQSSQFTSVPVKQIFLTSPSVSPSWLYMKMFRFDEEVTAHLTGLLRLLPDEGRLEVIQSNLLLDLSLLYSSMFFLAFCIGFLLLRNIGKPWPNG